MRTMSLFMGHSEVVMITTSMSTDGDYQSKSLAIRARSYAAAEDLLQRSPPTRRLFCSKALVLSGLVSHQVSWDLGYSAKLRVL